MHVCMTLSWKGGEMATEAMALNAYDSGSSTHAYQSRAAPGRR